ncbi:MAG TPA: nucleoside hydrolase [Dongiaceae bacterium]
MAGKRSVIIDTDPGVDDALALFLACASPELEIRAVTTVAGNVGINRTTRNAAALMALAGKPQVPIFRGAERPLAGTWSTIEDIHGQNGIGGAVIPDAPHGSRGPAIGALIDLLSTAEAESQTVVLLGPQTNLAQALQQQPGIAAAIREIVLMAGSLNPENGNASRYAEFNVHVDPEAARIVLECGRPMFWAPLEVARQASVDRIWIDMLRTTARPCCDAGADMLEFYLRSFEKAAAALYDPLAVLWLIAPNLFKVQGAALEIETKDTERAGQTRFDLGKDDSRIRVAVSCDADRVRTLMLERLAAL